MRRSRRLLAVLGLSLSLASCTLSGKTIPPAGTQTQALPINAFSTSAWQNFAMPQMVVPFTLEFDAVPSASGITALTSISSGPASDSNNGAVVLRFNPGGAIDASNGAGFGVLQAVPYTGGTSYHFRVSADPVAHTYSAIVTPDGDVDHILASGFAFAAAQASVTSLDDIGIEASVGSHAISNARLTIPISTQGGGGGDAGAGAPPQPAANLTAQSASSSSVALQWSETSSSVTGFTIQRRATHGTAGFAQVGQVAGTVTQYVDTGLTLWWQYDYQVIAFNAAGSAAPSNAVTVQVVPGASDAGTGGNDAGSGGGRPVHCNSDSGDATLLQAALNAGGSIALSGTCNLGSTTLTFGSNVTLTGPATLSYSGSGYALASAGNFNTVTGLTFDGGGIDLSLTDTTHWTGQYGWTVTDNVFQNIVNGNDAVHVENILGKGAASTLSRNTFTNIWQGGYPSFPASCTTGSSADPIDCVGGSGIFFHMGLDNTTIDSNTFDQIGFNAIKGFWDGFSGKIDPYTGHNIVISNNVMTRVHRIGIEVQGAGQGNCPGGCDYSTIQSDGIVIKGNFYHAPALQYDNFGFSLMTGSTHALIVNNTAVTENATCYWPIGIGLENAMLGGTLQGNVMGAVFQSCSGGYNPTHGWANYICPGYTRATDTNYFQNNISCGDQAAGEQVTHCDPYDAATNVETGDYWANSCPGGNGLATSSLSLSFTSSDNQSFPSGGNGTWNAGVVSNLSIRQVAFFIDGAATPAVFQELQDVSTSFASDRMWRYHATLDTTGLPPGSHRISAVATDVSGASQSAGQTFTR